MKKTSDFTGNKPKSTRYGPPDEGTIEYAKCSTMHALGPGEVAEREWAEAGLHKPDLAILRSYRLSRVKQQLQERDLAAIVLYDPLNVRYATDSTNLQIWVMHNAARYAFVPAEGPVIVYEFSNCEFLSGHSNVVDETRLARSWFYFQNGDRIEEHAKLWATEIADLVRQYGGGNMRLAIDRCNREGITALESQGVEIHNGEVVMEYAREIKCTEEIVAMCCAIEACERSIDVMRSQRVP